MQIKNNSQVTLGSCLIQFFILERDPTTSSLSNLHFGSTVIFLLREKAFLYLGSAVPIFPFPEPQAV